MIEQIINGKVITNLDDYKKEKWPYEFVAVPKIGSYIESKSKKILRVLSITHCVLKPYNEPCVKIEVG